jgi:hypothetical protein
MLSLARFVEQQRCRSGAAWVAKHAFWAADLSFGSTSTSHLLNDEQSTFGEVCTPLEHHKTHLSRTISEEAHDNSFPLTFLTGP